MQPASECSCNPNLLGSIWQRLWPSFARIEGSLVGQNECVNHPRSLPWLPSCVQSLPGCGTVAPLIFLSHRRRVCVSPSAQRETPPTTPPPLVAPVRTVFHAVPDPRGVDAGVAGVAAHERGPLDQEMRTGRRAGFVAAVVAVAVVVVFVSPAAVGALDGNQWWRSLSKALPMFGPELAYPSFAVGVRPNGRPDRQQAERKDETAVQQ